MSRLTIEASTPLCLLQDAGRFGVRHLGVTQGGAADWSSMSWANWLLGNGLDVPVIEITLGGFAVVAQQDCVLALAGADLGAQIDGQALASWRSFKLRKGQTLQFPQPRLGARAYLAAPGGFDAPQVLGSSATVVREELGGLDGLGLPLTKGATLSYPGETLQVREVRVALRPDLKLNTPLDLVRMLVAFCGPSRTLVMPAFYFGDPAIGGAYATFKARPRFDLRRTPSMMGIATELFRRMDGVLQSRHPVYRMSALGPLARALTEGHEFAGSPSGRGTPFEFMAKHNALIIGIGKPIQVLTQVHHVEALMGDPAAMPALSHCAQSGRQRPG